MDTFLLILSRICTVLLGISAFFDQWAILNQRAVFQGRPRIDTSILGKTSFKFFWFFFFTVTSLGLTDYSAQRADQKTQREIKQRDSENRKHEDSMIIVTTDSLNKTFTKALAEYYLTYSAEQKKVQSLLRDSISSVSMSILNNTDKQIFPINPLSILITFKMSIDKKTFNAFCPAYSSDSLPNVQKRMSGYGNTITNPSFTINLQALNDPINNKLKDLFDTRATLTFYKSPKILLSMIKSMKNFDKIAAINLSFTSLSISYSSFNISYEKDSVTLDISKKFDNVRTDEFNKFKIVGIKELMNLHLRCSISGTVLPYNYRIGSLLFYTGTEKRRSMLFNFPGERLNDGLGGYGLIITKNNYLNIY
ncbi:MAG: hypothetical protein J0H74_35870 [Chitinophagaceae bacterium]|nr:hypothetical protein [Chitinophagaceae bacterium]